MRKFAAWMMVCLLFVGTISARKAGSMKSDEKQAYIAFDTTTIELGTFSEDSAVVECSFNFTNTGDAPLIIHQALASCGCTIPTYTRIPIQPGESGKIDVTYNGAGKLPGRFKKTITVRTNASNAVVKIYITGEMTDSGSTE